MSIKSVLRRCISFPSIMKNKILLKLARVKTKGNHRIVGDIKIINKGSIEIGTNCVISGARDTIGFSGGCSLVTEGHGTIAIGDNFAMSNSTIFSRESIRIGNRVMIGGGCKIYDTDFHAIDSKWRGTDQDRTHAVNKSVTIDDSVFIGAGSIVLKGVHIGKEAVIGAGSVVTKDIPAGQIWAGNPARYIKDVR